MSKFIRGFARALGALAAASVLSTGSTAEAGVVLYSGPPDFSAWDGIVYAPYFVRTVPFSLTTRSRVTGFDFAMLLPRVGATAPNRGITVELYGAGGGALLFSEAPELAWIVYDASRIPYPLAVVHGEVDGPTLAAGDYVASIGGVANYLPTYSTAAGVVLYGETVSAGIPEPTTWALMLLGFGALGAALRVARGAPASRTSETWS